LQPEAAELAPEQLLRHGVVAAHAAHGGGGAIVIGAGRRHGGGEIDGRSVKLVDECIVEEDV
jgi:hypothetical protein